MKAVLISIQPKWCELIASGKKTVEVRKTKPKLETPFKVYIYCTLSGSNDFFKENCNGDISQWNKSKMALKKGKVIGEFVCKAVLPIAITYSDPNNRIALREFPFTCLTDKEIMDYLGNGVTGYGWTISDLVIYDTPKELREFYNRCYSGCDNCEYQSWDYSYAGGKDLICTCGNEKPLKRPPQSWCYVERSDNNGK